MPFSWDYGVLFLVGTLVGSIACAVAFGRFRFEVVPSSASASAGCCRSAGSPIAT
jgi:hypothetical protein